MVPLVLALAAAASPVASPSAAPPTIVHETVYPICSVLHRNLGNSIQAVLANDQAIAASKPLIANMGRSVESLGSVTANGAGNPYGPAQLGGDSPGATLDTERLERVIGTLEHNIAIIKQELKDPNLFPNDPKTSSERQAIRLKGLLQDVLTQQEQLLNVYYGLLGTRQLADLSGRGDPLQQLAKVDTPGEMKSRGSLNPLAPQNTSDTTFQDPKTQGSNSTLVNGPLAALPAQLYNPQFFTKNGIAGLEKSIYGRYYAVVDLEQGRISGDESELAERIILTTRECAGKRATEQPNP